MNQKRLLSLIVTSYNDREIIEPHFKAIMKILHGQDHYDWEVIFVDDGSSDGSVETLKKLAEKDSRVFLVELSRNFGQQKAFFAGMKQARGDIVITLDGDYQYEPACILDLANKIEEGFDLASGIRTKRHDPIFSRLTSSIGQRLVRRALRYPVKDFGAVKAFSRFLTEQIKVRENYCIMPYGMAYALTSRIAEVPVRYRPRVGRSKISGTLRGTICAGWAIVTTILRVAAQPSAQHRVEACADS